METNAKLITLASLIATLTAPLVHAQDQAPTSQPAPPVALNSPDRAQPPMGPGRRHGGDRRPGGADRLPGLRGMHSRGLTSLTTVSGTVGQWVGNDDAILNGFTLNSGSATTTVKFPTHLGEEVQKAVKTGGSVSVSGYTETSPRGETFFLMNSLNAGKTTVTNTPPAAPITQPETPALTTISGRIADYRLDKEGRANGLILDDKTIVNIPSHVAYQLTNLAQKGSTITVQGYPRTVRNGQVQLEKRNIMRASVLTINGQQYLVR
ncbi:hypothetical protein IC229_30045 [Spirosoma sp. BT702]|uniref:DUF5666 domain-containing protein n=1 Tax=Spirosoma profusum TaxID=2771354 RepID=A0A927AV02_9BACT|nr:hypothetical protein [Spirosoma profusum]MBD2704912.1 hypothetical protein [Spirosoma profusum]